MKTIILTVTAVGLLLTSCNSEKPAEVAAREGIRETIRLRTPAYADLSDIKFIPEKLDTNNRAVTKVVAEIKAREDLYEIDPTDEMTEPPVLKVTISKGEVVFFNGRLSGYQNGPKKWLWNQDLPDQLLPGGARPKSSFASNAVITGSDEYKVAKAKRREQQDGEAHKAKEQLENWKRESLAGLAGFQVGMKGQGELEEEGNQIPRMYRVEIIAEEGTGADRKLVAEFCELGNKGLPTTQKAKYLISFKAGLNQLILTRGEGRIRWNLTESRVSFVDGVFQITVGRVKTSALGIRLERVP